MTFHRWRRHPLSQIALALGLALVGCNSGGGGGGSSAPPPSPPSPPSGGWALTGNLNTARDSHTATVLTLSPNAGKVLVAGGSTASGTTLVIFSSTELYDPVAGTWTAANPMAVQRRNHTATRLSDGTILVAGGSTSSTTATGTAEIYNPVTGTWASTGNMTIARTFHTATLLPNGTVLVAGGTPFPGGLGLNTAEIYNPATGVWTATGSMGTARQAQTATLLQTGNVMVVGGGNLGTQQAELFDPATSTWRFTGNVLPAFAFHSAVLLPTGKVLIAGGAQGTTPIPSATLYDPLAETWTATGSMSIPRSGTTLVLLPTGNVLIAGGLTGNTVAASAETYIPSSGTWTTSGSLGTGRTAHTTTLLPTGQALAAGGLGADSSRLASTVLFTPTLPGTPGTWTATGNMNTPRQNHISTTVTLGSNAGKILVAGGSNSSSTVTASAELYDAAVGTWSPTGSLVAARQNFTANVLVSGPNAGKILVAGGLTSDLVPLQSAELYDPVAGTWSNTGAMSNMRGLHASVLLTAGPNAGKVLVAGGASIPVSGGFVSTNTVELYDPVSGTWSNTGSMITARSSFTLTILPTGKVLAAGGPSSTAELYDPATGTWTGTGSLSTARSTYSSTVLTFGPNGGKVLVAGGDDINGFPLASSELYDPILGTWTTAGGLQQGRFAFTATRLPNGQVLAAGGDLSLVATTSTAELFNPRTGTWTLTTPMGNSRGKQAASLLTQGQVLVSGGAVAGAPSALSELFSSSIP